MLQHPAELEEADGTEGSIAAMMPGFPELGPMVLQCRSEGDALRLRELAYAHGKASGRPVRLAHLVEDYETPRSASGRAQDAV